MYVSEAQWEVTQPHRLDGSMNPKVENWLSDSIRKNGPPSWTLVVRVPHRQEASFSTSHFEAQGCQSVRCITFGMLGGNRWKSEAQFASVENFTESIHGVKVNPVAEQIKQIKFGWNIKTMLKKRKRIKDEKKKTL